MTDAIRQRLEAGLQRHQAGDLTGAEDIYREVLNTDPENADGHHFLGLIAHQRGAPEKAIQLIGRAVSLAPDRATFHFNLGAAYLTAGDTGRALTAYEEAARLDPDNISALQILGGLLGQAGRFDAAETVLRQALDKNPDFPEALCGLAAALNGLNRWAEAASAAERATELAPGMSEAWTNLGNALEKLDRVPEAETAHRRAIEADPAAPLPPYNLGNLLIDSWRTVDGIQSFRNALAADPDYRPAQGNLLLNLLYLEDQTEESLFREHSGRTSHWARTSSRSVARQGDAERRLRIGYVSPDFRTHSCAYFLEPLLSAHNKDAVEVFAYANVQRPDDTTARLQGYIDHWRDIWGMSDKVAAGRIEDDDIDILVDLAGHSANGRLGIFAQRPAPVQVSWLGYPATTGLPEIDYRITDEDADPTGASDQWHSEALIRLDGGFHCYQAPGNAPDVGPLPYRHGSGITFGSFNNLSKMTPAVVRTWAAILNTVEGSRLMLKGRILGNAVARDRILQAFAGHEVADDRLVLHDWIPRDQSPLSLYNQIDIALDTFPYNGTTTSFEALWMGVPVISLAGQRHAGRVGLSILKNLGLAELVAGSEADYIAKACELAADPDRLETLRTGLRGRMMGSSLCDAGGFTEKLETAYRDMWRKWSAGA